MDQVHIKNPPPAFVRWVTGLAGVVLMLVCPAFGVKSIVTQHIAQSASTDSRGRYSSGFELYGPAAIGTGLGIATTGLAAGYALAFRFSRKSAFKPTKLDRLALVMFVGGILVMIVSQRLPTRTGYGDPPPEGCALVRRSLGADEIERTVASSV